MVRQILGLTLFIILFGCDAQPENNISTEVNGAIDAAAEYDDSTVLTVGDKTFVGAQLTAGLNRLNGDSLMVHQKMESYINRSLILQDAYARGIASTPAMEFTYDEWERDKLQNLWLTETLEHLVTLPADTVEQYYSQMGTTLLYRAITVGDSAYCDSLRQLVLSGSDMGDLAEEHSIIPYGVTSRGVYGPVDMMEVFYDDYILLRDLEHGELSSVDLSNNGWRFLRIDSTYQDTVPPLEEITDLISARILGRLKLMYQEDLFDSLRVVNNLQITEGIPELIASHFSRDDRSYEAFTSDQEDMVAYSFTDGERTLHSLVENIRQLPPMVSYAPYDPEWIGEHSRLLGLYDIMAMEAMKLSMDTLPEVVSYMDQRFNNRVLDIYFSEVIEPRLIPTEEKLLEIYEAERDSFIVPEGRIFNTIAAVGEEQLILLEQLLEAGDDPFSRAAEFSQVTSILAPGESIITRVMTAAEIPPPYDEMLFSSEMNAAFACSVEAERVLFFELTEIIPEHIASYSDSHDQLLIIFRALEEEEVLSVLIDSLSSIYHIEVDWEFVDSFVYADSSSTDQFEII
ncbi:MAG: hypothetical protein ABFR50_00920 [Candidatus Fermentibacteria bacterium]